MYLLGSLFATVVFTTVLKLSCTSQTIFIKTNNSSDHECPAKPCLTLQKFKAHFLVKSNTVLKFLPGKHATSFANKSIYIIRAVNVTLTGVSDQQSSVIHCVSEFSINAIIVQNLTISNLHFSGCGAPILEKIIGIFGVFRSATIALVLASNVSVLDTQVYNSKGPGMLASNTFDLILNRTSFVGNIPNCAIYFTGDETPAELHCFTYIVDSEFAYGKSDDEYYGGGLSLTFYQTQYRVHVKIVNVALYNNTGKVFGNFVLTITEWSYKYTIVRAEKVRCINNLRYTQTGFIVREVVSPNSTSLQQRNHSLAFEYTLHVSNSYFETSMDVCAVRVICSNKLESSNLRVKFTDIIISYSNHKVVYGYTFEIISVSPVVMERINITDSCTSHISIIDSELILHNAFILKNRGIVGVL